MFKIFAIVTMIATGQPVGEFAEGDNLYSKDDCQERIEDHKTNMAVERIFLMQHGVQVSVVYECRSEDRGA